MTPITIQWPTPPDLHAACTRWECPNGHFYPALLQTIECAGCHQPLIAIKLHNCPFCNEPPRRLRTTAVLAPSQTITPPCQETNNALQSVEILIDYAIPAIPDPAARCTGFAESPHPQESNAIQ